jgi:hypothetical protein
VSLAFLVFFFISGNWSSISVFSFSLEQILTVPFFFFPFHFLRPQLSNAAAAHGGVHAKRARVSDDDDTELWLHLQQPDPDVVNAKSEPLDCQSNADDRRALWLKYSHWDNRN